MRDKICYVVNFYLGDRRGNIDSFVEDRFFYLKTQIEYLKNVNHSLEKIIFNFNIREEDYHFIPKIFEITPRKILNSEVEVRFRKNFGMSYGAWSDVFGEYREIFDYYIFNEDDYFFVENNWDQYLVNKFNSLENCGYLCIVVREGKYEWCNFKKHAGHASGISSFDALNKVYQKYGELPHSKEGDYHSAEQLGQINQSHSFIEIGYEIYDVRDDYRVSFFTSDPKRPIWRFFWWNEKDLIVPAFLLENIPHIYWESDDDEFKPYRNSSNNKEGRK
jgi:hypothetical protein